MSTKTIVLAIIAVSAFLVGAHSDAQTMQAEKEWCIEMSYTNAPATYADMYQCNKYGIALDNIINQ